MIVLQTIFSFFSWLGICLITISLTSLSVLFIALGSGQGSQWCIHWWARSILFVAGIRTEIINPQKAKIKENVVIVANHHGAVDIFVLAAFIPFHYSWLAKKELFKIPFLGWHMKYSGYLPVDRNNPRQAKEALTRATEKVRQGGSVLFFPEGTRSNEGELRNFKRGAFELSLETGVKILPVTLINTAAVLPGGSFIFRPGRVKICFDDLISPEQYLGQRMALTKKAREVLQSNYQKYQS